MTSTIRGERVGVSRGFRAQNGVARNFRKQHGEVAFTTLASEVFREADEDCSGKIDAVEVANVLKKLGLVLSPDEVGEVMRRYDVGSSDDTTSAGNGTLDEKEWIELVSDLIDGTFDAKAVEAVEEAAKAAENPSAAAPQSPLRPDDADQEQAPSMASGPPSPARNDDDAKDVGAPSSISTATTPRARISTASRAGVDSGVASAAEVEKLSAENRVLAARVFELEAANARLEERMDALERRLASPSTPPSP
jgi:hypothetical protein